jgi:hypothetical protein
LSCENNNVLPDAHPIPCAVHITDGKGICFIVEPFDKAEMPPSCSCRLSIDIDNNGLRGSRPNVSDFRPRAVDSIGPPSHVPYSVHMPRALLP